MSICEVREWVDVFFVQKRVREIADSLGFSRRERGELVIVASELTSNILKYGVRGSVEIQPLVDANGVGLSLIASDCGPPFRDLSAALRDGWDDQGPIDPMVMMKRKGIGGGLGAIVRLTHSFRVEPHPIGKKIYVVRYLPKVRSFRPPRRRR